MPREPFVLVVDDDPQVLSLLSMRLEQAGYPVTTAADGWQEVIQASNLKVGLVITDIHMPGATDGLAAYGQLRENFPELPVIFITGDHPEQAKRLLPADAKVRLVSKPIDFAKLSQAIKELTGKDRPL